MTHDSAVATRQRDRSDPRHGGLVIHGPACVGVGQPKLDGLAHIDLVHEIVPAGLRWEFVDEAVRFRTDVGLAVDVLNPRVQCVPLCRRLSCRQLRWPTCGFSDHLRAPDSKTLTYNA